MLIAKQITIVFRGIYVWLASCFCYLVKAVSTYNNAVFLIESSPLFSGNILYRKPFIFLVVGVKLLTTSVTYNNCTIPLWVGTLVKPSMLDRLIIELSRHNINTPFTGWLPSKCTPNDSCYFANSKFTGLIINYRYYSLLPLPFHVIDIRQNNTLLKTNDFYKAMKVAEVYYSKLETVNTNGSMFNKTTKIEQYRDKGE